MEIKVTVPQMGESVVECTLTRWLKKAGDAVVRDEPLYEVSSDKVDTEIPAPASGTLREIIVPEGQTVKINAVVALILEAGDAAATPSVAVAQPASDTEKENVEEAPAIRFLQQRASPLVRKIAREENVDLSLMTGSGLEGRITKDDVLNHIARRAQSAAPAAMPAQAASNMNAAGGQEITANAASRFWGESETIPMTPMRKAIAEHMVFSRTVSAHVNTVFEVDVSSIVQLREAHKTEFMQRNGIQLTVTPFFAKALIDAIREYPILNASVSGDAIIYKKPVHLGIAVALDSGLIVPVIRDAHLKNFSGLALAIHDLAERARTKRLKPDDVQNGTITLTNPGAYGPLFETPIINQPQVAILGIGGINKRPVVINDAIAIRSIVCLSLSYDHRIIDGVVADQFMAALKSKLQNWTQWLE